MTSSRRARIARRVLLGLLLAPLLVWGGATVVVKLTVAREVPLPTLAGLVASGLFRPVLCVFGGCEPDLVEGLELERWGETLLTGTPVALEIDERGRILVAEAGRMGRGTEDDRDHPDWLQEDLAARRVEDRLAYQARAIADGRIADPDHFTAHADRLVLLEDEDGDGRPDRRRELARWNEPATGLVAGVEAREGEIHVAVIPSLLRLRDEDFDGVLEQAETLHTGFGVKTSLIGHDLHGFAWGPDGRLYFSIGDRGYHVVNAEGRLLEPPLGPGRGAVFRMQPDGRELEVFATGLRNPQELAFDDYGNLVTGDNNGDGGDAARLVYVVEGGDSGWAMPYQSLAGDYVRGPWMAERLWELQHDTQPAWILPPIGHVGNGPAGLVHAPGLGLPERYADHFLLCDYAYTHGRSGLWSFALEPEGAGLRMVDLHRFAWSLLATDVDFGWDGRLFVTLFDQFGGGQELAMLSHRDARDDPRLAELEAIAAQPMGSRSSEALLALLDLPDQRIRLRAQFELAARREEDGLARLARDEGAALVTRLHAIWGLGQIGADAVAMIAGEDFDWLREAPSELRAQVARTLGEARAGAFTTVLRRWLADPSARVRFFAAQSLAALGDRGSVEALVALLRENADRDVFLRHAAVRALHRSAEPDALLVLAQDPSRSVRLGVLLALRLAGDPRIARFLADEDPLLVVEAARAIYDVPIDGAMGALARLADGLSPAPEEDRQTARALHRRVLGANLRTRAAAGAERLARYAADARQPEALRRIALEALARFDAPPPRDLAMGFHRPLPPASPEIVERVLAGQGPALMASSLGAEALALASERGVLPLTDPELVERAMDPRASEAVRVAAVEALAARVAAGGALPEDERERVLGSALASAMPALRSAGRELLHACDAERALAAWVRAAEQAPAASERQRAWSRLATFDAPAARAALERGLTAWEQGRGDPAAALELLEAARTQSDPALAVRARAGLAADPARPVESRAWALAGGDVERGRVVFETHGDCLRCHGAGPGQGAGPRLVGERLRDPRFVLESIVDPQARLAPGFEGDGRGQSAMPPIGLALEPRALRDLVAYVTARD